ncbi:MAG TPA: hypothetical protein VLK23_00470 [Thermodesulfobacteriota bacterium]|nr:hypothetical protein [Thermodesulfobacteriota bacterium]
MEIIREEIEKIEKSAERIKRLGQDNPSLRRNAEALLAFVYILKFITPQTGKEEDRWNR